MTLTFSGLCALPNTRLVPIPLTPPLNENLSIALLLALVSHNSLANNVADSRLTETSTSLVDHQTRANANIWIFSKK